MTEHIYWILELDIKNGAVAQLRELLAEMVAATEADEPGTLYYEWFISEDETKCHIYERYADAAALMTHLGNFGSKFAGRFMSILQPTRMTVYGDTNEQVVNALNSMGAQFMAPLGGFNR